MLPSQHNSHSSNYISIWISLKGNRAAYCFWQEEGLTSLFCKSWLALRYYLNVGLLMLLWKIRKYNTQNAGPFPKITDDTLDFWSCRVGSLIMFTVILVCFKRDLAVDSNFSIHLGNVSKNDEEKKKSERRIQSFLISEHYLAYSAQW